MHRLPVLSRAASKALENGRSPLKYAGLPKLQRLVRDRAWA